eukprot:31110-Pelagococcus_subviridis.AAC.2
MLERNVADEQRDGLGEARGVPRRGGDDAVDAARAAIRRDGRARSPRAAAAAASSSSSSRRGSQPRERVDVADRHRVPDEKTARRGKRLGHRERDRHLGDALLGLDVAERGVGFARRRGVDRRELLAKRDARRVPVAADVTPTRRNANIRAVSNHIRPATPATPASAVAVTTAAEQRLQRGSHRGRVRRDVQRDAVAGVDARVSVRRHRPRRASIDRGALERGLHALRRDPRVDLHDDVRVEPLAELRRAQREVEAVEKAGADAARHGPRRSPRRARRSPDFGAAHAKPRRRVRDDRPAEKGGDLARGERVRSRPAAGDDEQPAPRGSHERAQFPDSAVAVRAAWVEFKGVS